MNKRLFFSAFVAFLFTTKPASASNEHVVKTTPYFWCVDITKLTVVGVADKPGWFDATVAFTTGLHGVKKSFAIVSSKDTVSHTIEPFVTEDIVTLRFEALSEKDIVIFVFIAERPWDNPPCHVYDINLPVTFESFTAKRQDNTVVVLNWTTASELNNKGFEVQKTADAGGWQTIGFVESLAKALDGNSQTQLSYQYVDNSTTRFSAYYRLKQIDRDGTIAYSKIVSVRAEGGQSALKVFPNPVRSGFLNVEFEDANALHHVSFVDTNGKELKKWTKANDVIQVDINGLKPGFYVLSIINLKTNKRSTQKIVVL